MQGAKDMLLLKGDQISYSIYCNIFGKH